MDLQRWRAVDDHLEQVLHLEDDALRRAREAGTDAGLPAHEVAPNQGALLALLARAAGARTVLEIGTLAGYSAIWWARAVGPDGRVTTLEVDEQCARVARANLERAGVADRVDVLLGPALETLDRLRAQDAGPYDVVFIDADKPSNPAYLEVALALSRPGTLVIGDNVVRGGEVLDAASDDDRVRGVRRFLELLGEDPRLAAVTAVQTVGRKGWDGLAVALVQ